MDKILLSVEPFQETLHAGMCGPASLKIILAYHGIDKTESELAAMCRAGERLGVNENDLQRVAEDLGFHVTIKNKSAFDDIALWFRVYPDI